MLHVCRDSKILAFAHIDHVIVMAVCSQATCLVLPTPAMHRRSCAEMANCVCETKTTVSCESCLTLRASTSSVHCASSADGTEGGGGGGGGLQQSSCGALQASLLAIDTLVITTSACTISPLRWADLDQFGSNGRRHRASPATPACNRRGRGGIVCVCALSAVCQAEFSQLV